MLADWDILRETRGHGEPPQAFSGHVLTVTKSWFSGVPSAGRGSSGPPSSLRPLHGLGEDDEIDTSVSSEDLDYTNCLLQWYKEH